MRLAVMAALVMLVGCGGTESEATADPLCGTLTAQCRCFSSDDPAVIVCFPGRDERGRIACPNVPEFEACPPTDQIPPRPPPDCPPPSTGRDPNGGGCVYP